jgi:hypothetical protein
MSAFVTNCHPTLVYECPREWDRLVPTGREHVRFCHTCSRRVFLCESPDESERHAEAGHYVAEEVAEFCGQTCG